uniref:Variant surface glycoprotein 1342 n=1 Tax=Trypanosoma brucei TaxID=5691 RepID=M4TBF0_9TRYP|nr:variant surface glycoprotein 1342 [Trypanosoma brucei]
MQKKLGAGNTTGVTAVVLLLLTSTKPIAGAVAAGDNAAAFEVLCDLISLAKSQPAGPKLESDSTSAYEELLKLNSTLSPKEWTDKFVDNANAKTYHQAVPPKITDPGNWKELWPDWVKAVEAVAKEENMDEIKKMNLANLNPRQLETTTVTVRQLAEEARELRKERAGLAGDLKLADDDTIRKQLNKAAFGDENTGQVTPAAAKVFSSASQTYTAACSTTGAAQKATAVLAAAACLCVKDHTDNEAQYCGKSAKLTATWTTASATIPDTAVTEPAAFWKAKAAPTLTSGSLQSKLEAVTRLIRVSTNAAILGTSETGTCTGKDTAGVCVSVTDGAQGKSPDASTFTWGATLKTLADNLRKKEETVKKAKQLDEKIQQLKARAFKTTIHTNIVKAGTADAKDQPAQDASQTSHVKADCKKHNNSKTKF